MKFVRRKLQASGDAGLQKREREEERRNVKCEVRIHKMTDVSAHVSTLESELLTSCESLYYEMAITVLQWHKWRFSSGNHDYCCLLSYFTM
jgi:hypothetical protein